LVYATSVTPWWEPQKGIFKYAGFLRIGMSQGIEVAEAAERYLLLLAGQSDRAIPSEIHAQKELFLLSRSWKRAAEALGFRKHYFGPYSESISQAYNNPAYFEEAFILNNDSVSLGAKGKQVYSQIVANEERPEFNQLLSELRLLRELYDPLSPEEVMFLVYEVHPEYTELSEKVASFSKPEKRRQIINGLLRKGAITMMKAEELLK
jgi:hypothetical protein